MLRQMTQQEKEDTFGPLPKILGLKKDGTYDFGWDGDIIDWERGNIVTMLLPGELTLGWCNEPINDLRCHKLVADDLSAAFKDIYDCGLWGDIITFDGCLGYRPMRGSNIISSHSYGVAFDLNAKWNPLRGKPAAPGEIGSLHRIAPIMEAHRFIQLPHDMMHFERGKHD